MITGGPACGDSNRARKALWRNARDDNHTANNFQAHAVYEVSQGSEGTTFNESDRESPQIKHNDALVISVSISNFWVKKVLIDSGSSADIIFHNAFIKMGIANAQLTPVSISNFWVK